MIGWKERKEDEIEFGRNFKEGGKRREKDNIRISYEKIRIGRYDGNEMRKKRCSETREIRYGMEQGDAGGM